MKAARPDVKTRAKFWSAQQDLLVTMSLIGINLAVFVYVTLRDPASLSGSGSIGSAQLGLTRAALDSGPVGFGLPGNEVYVSDGSDWYRLVTSGFLHFGILHIAFNLYFLYVLGRIIEPLIGRIKFLLVYVASLLAGSAGAIVLQPEGLHGGASGAVFGLLGLLFVGYYLRGINPFTTGIGTVLILNLVITFTIGGISIGGHLGGVIAGGLCALVVIPRRPGSFPPWAAYAWPVVIGLLSVAVTIYAVQNSWPA